MSWSAFEEFKNFASSIYRSKNKRKKDWNTPTTKRQKSSNQPSNLEESNIDGFSSEEEKNDEKQDTCSRLFISKENKKNEEEHTKAKQKRFATDSDAKPDLESLIDDIEDTPEDDETERIPSTSGIGMKINQTNKNEDTPDLEPMIKDFNSSDEEEKNQEPEVLDIGTPTPTPTPNLTPSHSVIPERTPRTGSEWLKQLQQHTPTSSQDTPPSPDVKVDSAKKKPKFKRSGLAEQLQRLINREKSEKSFWTHKQAAKKNELNATVQDSTSAIDVLVLSLYTQYSLHITRCCVLSSKEESVAPIVVDVVFNTQTLKQLMLRVGSAIRIHPPWQKLIIPSSSYPILLCTYYCEMLPTPAGPLPVDVTSLTDFSWLTNEPHQEISHLVSSPKKCFQPTKLLFGDGEPKANKEEATDISAIQIPNEGSQMKKPSKQLLIAKAIEAQGGCSGGSVSFQAVVQRVYRRRVKVAREKAFDSPSDGFLSKSLVTRARSAEDKEEARWVMLVQDASKSLCEIQIPLEYASSEDWSSCIRKGNGKAYVFRDLRITQRTNRARSPGLFNVVDCLWDSECGDCHQDDKSSQILSSEESGSHSSPLSSPPNHCYVLTVQDSSRVTSLDDEEQQALSSLYKPPLLTNLRELFLYDNEAPRRCAVWCRVICTRPNLLKNTTRHSSTHPSWTGQFLVTDASLHRGLNHTPQESQNSASAESFSRYMKLEMRLSHVLSESVREAVVEGENVLYMKDIACTRKGIYADSYTTIKRGSTDPCLADIEKGDVQAMPLNVYSDLVALRTREFILPFSSNTTPDALCKVHGIVNGVDEESACCWLECTACACQDLVERSGLPYYCPVCMTDVLEPQTKTNLDVIMKCDSWKEGQVIVKLLQATIEQLLPVSYQDSDQGYDIECVLGKRLGPLYCYVKEHTGSTAKLEEIALSF